MTPSILTLNPTASASINDNILIDWSHHDPPVLDFFVGIWRDMAIGCVTVDMKI